MSHHSPTLDNNWAIDFQDISFTKQVRLAKTHYDMFQIGRLRYDLFVKRDGKAYDAADHQNQTLIEPVDTISLNFTGILKDELVAAVRLTRLSHFINDELISGLVSSIGLHERDLINCSLNSRLSIKENSRGAFLITSIFRSMYSIAIRNNIKLGFVLSNKDNLELFKRFGFRDTNKYIYNKNAGTLKILALDTKDLKYLSDIKSPFTKYNTQIHQKM